MDKREMLMPSNKHLMLITVAFSAPGHMKFVALAGLVMVAAAIGDCFIGMFDEAENLFIFGVFISLIGAVGVLVALRSDAGRN
jgi:hypothetical protein